jgi:hypothetical protein
MKNKKIISEQSNPQTIDMTQSVKLNCFDAYKVWFDIDPDKQPKKTKSGKIVVTGKNKKGETVFFFDNGIVKNIVTNLTKHWKCDATDSMNQSQTKNSDVLKTFGLTANDTAKAKQITGILQGLVDKGAVSDIFVKWNDLLTNVFRDSTLLKLNSDNNALPMNKEDLQLKFGTDMKDKLQQQYGWNNVSLYLPTGNVSQATNVEIKLDQATCNQVLSTYIQSAFQYQYQNITPRTDRLQIQGQINRCYGGGMYNDFKGYPDGKLTVTNSDGTQTQTDLLSTPSGKNPFIGGIWTRILRGVKSPFEFVKKLLNGEMTDYITDRNPYVFSIGGIQKESKDKALKSLIRENLLELSNEKKKNSISESKIIKTRGNILIEGRIVETKEQQERFFNEILSEAIYLNSQGFDRDLINEGFWDTITGFFSNHGTDSIAGTFKEFLTKGVISWFGGDPNSWLSTAVETAVGNINISDYGRLTECDFLTKEIAKTISETAISKIQHDKGMTGGIWDTIRNGLVDALDESTFAQKIEGYLVKTICPKLNGLKTKLEDKAQDMKTKALAA